jgi:hypothetical protein
MGGDGAAQFLEGGRTGWRLNFDPPWHKRTDGGLTWKSAVAWPKAAAVLVSSEGGKEVGRATWAGWLGWCCRKKENNQVAKRFWAGCRNLG